MAEIMKLQNNFTTSEQSKRLLELGVPVDSADCIAFILTDPDWEKNNFQKGESKIVALNPRHTYTGVATLEEGCKWIDEPYPCWSVGRLIEIYLICNEVIDNVTELHHSAIKIDVREFNTVEYLISKLTNKVKKNKEFFSKLEE